jgi:hypothetical protein
MIAHGAEHRVAPSNLEILSWLRPVRFFFSVCAVTNFAPISSPFFRQQYQRCDDNSHYGFRHVKISYSALHSRCQNLSKTNNGDERDDKETGAQNSCHVARIGSEGA